jgi:predicted transcriptional regulator
MNEKMPQGKQTVTDREIIEAMEESSDPIHSAREIAEIVGVTRQCAFDRLQQLREEGRVDSKKSGARTVVWWPLGQDS